MIDYRKVEALKKDPSRARVIAQSIRFIRGAEWDEYESEFLADMACRRDELSTRQAEFLIELEEEAVRLKTYEGFGVKPLVTDCLLWRGAILEQAPHLLGFLEMLVRLDYPSLTKRQWRKLLACARITHSIETDAVVT